MLRCERAFGVRAGGSETFTTLGLVGAVAAVARGSFATLDPVDAAGAILTGGEGGVDADTDTGSGSFAGSFAAAEDVGVFATTSARTSAAAPSAAIPTLERGGRRDRSAHEAASKIARRSVIERWRSRGSFSRPRAIAARTGLGIIRGALSCAEDESASSSAAQKLY